MKTNNAKNFVMLACVALKEGHTEDAANLMAQATKLRDFDEYLAEGLAGNYQAQTWIESLASSEEEFDSISASFKLELDKAFNFSLSTDGEDDLLAESDDDNDDYELGVGTDDGDDDDDDELESDSKSSSPLAFRF